MKKIEIRYPVFWLSVLLLLGLITYGATQHIFAQSAAEVEPNGTFGGANAISLTSPTSGTINPVQDSDWFTFVVERHGELRAQISNVAPTLDVNLRVWTGNKDALTNWYAPLAKGGNTDAIVDLPAPGRYFLEVRDGNLDLPAKLKLDSDLSLRRLGNG